MSQYSIEYIFQGEESNQFTNSFNQYGKQNSFFYNIEENQPQKNFPFSDETEEFQGKKQDWDYYLAQPTTHLNFEPELLFNPEPLFKPEPFFLQQQQPIQELTLLPNQKLPQLYQLPQQQEKHLVFKEIFKVQGTDRHANALLKTTQNQIYSWKINDFFDKPRDLINQTQLDGANPIFALYASLQLSISNSSKNKKSVDERMVTYRKKLITKLINSEIKSTLGFLRLFYQGYELFIKLYLLRDFENATPQILKNSQKHFGDYLRYLDLWTFREEYGRNNKDLEGKLNYNLKMQVGALNLSEIISLFRTANTIKHIGDGSIGGMEDLYRLNEGAVMCSDFKNQFDRHFETLRDQISELKRELEKKCEVYKRKIEI